MAKQTFEFRVFLGRTRLYVAPVPLEKIVHFSFFIRTKLDRGQLNLHYLDVNAHDFDPKIGKRVLDWIATNDMANPRPLTIAGLRIEAFDEAVYAYQAAHHIRIHRELRGEDVRAAIFEYVKQGALRFDEFAMIYELIGFDHTILKCAMNQIMFGKVLGGRYVAPEFDQIEAYARVMGLWPEMVAIEEQIRWKRMMSGKQPMGNGN